MTNDRIRQRFDYTAQNIAARPTGDLTELKRGQRVYLRGADLRGGETLEPCNIVRRRHGVTSIPNDEWYEVRFEHGGRILVHRTGLALGNQVAA